MEPMVNLNDSSKMITAYQSKVKAQIIHLLKIYDELSTLELADILGKSKSTILRNMEAEDKKGLVDLEMVIYEEKDSPGKYPKRVYKLKKQGYNIDGQKMIDYFKEDPKRILEYNNYRIGEFTLVRNIMNSAINYLERMGDELMDNIDNVQDIMEIRKDNLGTVNYQYMTITQLQNLVREENIPLPADEKKEYLRLNIILPIRRLVEMENSRDWKRDGTLWFYDR